MLQPILQKINAQRIILASGSPRRKQILQNIGLNFEVVPSTFEEDLDKALFPHPSDYVKESARIKALDVAVSLASDSPSPDLVIGADTVVALDNKIYEKPRDRSHAVEMLTSFSGRSHTVYTGVALCSPATSTAVYKTPAISLPDMRTAITSGDLTKDGRFRLTVFCEATEVMMSDMSQEVIEAYVDTGEPMDKAGGYGIQAIGGTLVAGIKGDYFNVMGFPLHKFARTLASSHRLKKCA